MKYKMNDIFKNQNLSSEELAYWSKQFNEIDNNFKNKIFEFDKLKNTKDYYDILIKYLKVNGYGYLSSKINRKMSNVELSKLLIDSNLIDKPELSKLKMNTNLKDEISYDKGFGFRGEYYLKYNDTFPFEINSIYYKESKNLRCKLNKSKNKINILIDINENTEINLEETIVIYTSLGLKEMSLSIKCNNALNSEIDVKDFDEFRNLCTTDLFKAKEIFDKREFRDWLKKRGYVTQVINYDEAIILSNFLENQFINFCLLNEIYIDTSILVEKETTIEELEEPYVKETEIKEDKQKESYELKQNQYIDADFTIKNDNVEETYDTKNKENLFEGKEQNSNNYKTKVDDEEKTNKSHGFISKIKSLFKKK